jgi:hypothetical protein
MFPNLARNRGIKEERDIGRYVFTHSLGPLNEVRAIRHDD